MKVEEQGVELPLGWQTTRFPDAIENASQMYQEQIDHDQPFGISPEDDIDGASSLR